MAEASCCSHAKSHEDFWGQHKDDKAAQEYSLDDPKDLIRFLSDADIRLVRWSFLKELEKSGRLFPRRQEAQAETFVDDAGNTLDALVSLKGQDGSTFDSSTKLYKFFGKRTLILSVSHAWEAQQHPDPWGHQLSRLVEALSMENDADRECLLFYDWTSIPQYLRTEAQQASFDLAMKNMDVLYSHNSVEVYKIEDLTPEEVKVGWSPSKKIQIYSDSTGKVEPRPYEELVTNGTPYHTRGWCAAEVQWMAAGQELIHNLAPMIPSTFRAKVSDETGGTKLKFTHRGDAEPVLQLQEKVFYQAAKSRTEAQMWELPFEQVLYLADALRFFQNLKKLEALDGNDLGDEGAVALAAGLQHCPHIEEISLRHCKIGPKGAAALAEVCRQCTRLKKLDLWNNPLLDEGAAALADGLKASTSIEEVNVSVCGIGPAGRKALEEIGIQKLLTQANRTYRVL